MDENLVIEWKIYNSPDLTHLPLEERKKIRERIEACEKEIKDFKKYLREANGSLEIDYNRFCHIENICAERGYTIGNLIDEILKKITDDEIREIMLNIDYHVE